MMEVAPYKEASQESIDLLEAAHRNLEENLKRTVDYDLSNPLDEKRIIPYYESYSFGLNVIDILLELTRSGFDILQGLNDKRSAVTKFSNSITRE